MSLDSDIAPKPIARFTGGDKLIEQLHLTFVATKKLTGSMSEKELGKKWDRCLADSAVKVGK